MCCRYLIRTGWRMSITGSCTMRDGVNKFFLIVLKTILLILGGENRLVPLLKKVFHTSILIYLSSFAIGQTIVKSKEVKVTYTNGYQVFNICIANPQMT